MKYDLHSHSNFSDGSLSPKRLIEEAKQAGISHLALTDHDTLDGLPEARLAAEQQSDITLINGIELSCTWENQLLHIVGLNIDPGNKRLKAGVHSNQQRRLKRAEAMLEDFEQHDIFLRDAVAAQLVKKGVPTRPHFAQALIDQGFAKDKKQAFKRYLVKGKPGYIPMRWPELSKVADWITGAGGVAVLAHPNRYKFTRSKLSRLIAEMLACGVQSMEVSTSSTDKQQMAMLGELAQRFGLLASVGSDFHSLDQPWARLGCAEPLSSSLTPVWEKFNL